MKFAAYLLFAIISINFIMVNSLIPRSVSRLFSRSTHLLAKKAVLPQVAAVSTASTTTTLDPITVDESPSKVPKKKRADRKIPKEGYFHCKPVDEFNSSFSDTGCQFKVYGEPIALSRHRVTRVGIMYNPSAKFQADFLSACSAFLPPAPLEGGIAVHMVFYFSRPKNHYGTGKNANVLKTAADIWHTKRSGAMKR